MAVGRRLEGSGDLDAVLLGPALDDADDAVHLCGQRMGMWDSKPVGAANPTAESELAGAGEGGDGTGGGRRWSGGQGHTTREGTVDSLVVNKPRQNP